MWQLSDEALTAGFAAGDRRAATAFVRRFQSRVFGLILSMVGDSAVAEELAQETFSRAWRHAGSYDPRRGRVVTWLLAIARNLAIDHLRARRPEPLDPATIVDPEQALWTQPGEARERSAEAAEELRAALVDVPEDQRRALLLAALFGYTAREIGTIEQIPLGTAKTRIRAAMQALARGQAAREAGDGGEGR